MADWLALFAAAAALYLLECCVWVKAATPVCYRTPWGSRVWRVARGADLPGNHRGGIAFASPLRVSGSVTVPGDWPISISPEGVANLAATATYVTTAASRHIAFDSIKTVSRHLNQLLINEKVFAEASSAALAEHLVQLIRRLREQPVRRRASIIRAAINDVFDRKAAEKAWSAAESRGRSLAPWGGVLGALIFGVSPLVIMTYGPIRTWKLLLGLVVALAIATAIMFFRHYKAMFPQLHYDRWVNGVSMILLPLSAVRGSDKLTRDALFLHSGLIVAPLVAGDGALTYLRSELMDLERQEQIDGAPDDLDGCVRWFRAGLAAEARTALGDLYDRAFEPPAPENEAAAAYCPRCHTQYLTAEQRTCADCPDVLLKTFTSCGRPAIGQSA